MKKYAYLAGSIACILFLYFLSAISHPPEISISDLEKYEGKRVVVEGMVVDKEFNDKSEIITLKDGNHSARIFIRGSTEASYGDIVKVTGRVGRYGNQLEIFSESVEIREKWDERSMPLWELSENFEKYLGTNVNVTGYVNGVHTRYFYLTDFEREYRIKVFYPENFSMEIENYEHIYVKALFKYDSKNMCMYLEIKEKEHGIGKVD